MDERVRHSELLYEQAVFTGDAELLSHADRELDAAEADLALARGKLAHTRFLLQNEDEGASRVGADPVELPLFERAADLYRKLGDTRGEADAVFWVGCFHQVIRRDNATAVPLLERSLEIATHAEDTAVMAECLRHLGIAAHATGNLETARSRLEESTRLRREANLMPAVAANMVGLAYIAAAQGRTEDAMALISEASSIARSAQADRVLGQLDEVREAIVNRDS